MERKMPKGYAVLWAVFAAAYGVWMAVFMPKYVLDNYENMPAEMLVDGKVYSNLSGMVGAHWLYPIWVVISVAALLLFIVYFKKFLYCEKQTNAMTVTAAVLLVAGCVFVVVYGFLGEEPFINKVKFVTASMIGLEFPWLFRVWGVLGSASVFINTLYCYRKYGYNSRAGLIAGSIGAFAIFITINCPSVGSDPAPYFPRPRMLGHWAGALIFAVGCAAPVVIFLFSAAKRFKGRFAVTAVVFAGLLLVMLVLLITVGKSAIIENIPMVAAYILLFLFNFTHIYDRAIDGSGNSGETVCYYGCPNSQKAGKLQTVKKNIQE